MLLGGRVAEEVVFQDPTTGASNDIERVSKLARKMVCEYGMSEKLGPWHSGDKGISRSSAATWATMPTTPRMWLRDRRRDSPSGR